MKFFFVLKLLFSLSLLCWLLSGFFVFIVLLHSWVSQVFYTEDEPKITNVRIIPLNWKKMINSVCMWALRPVQKQLKCPLVNVVGMFWKQNRPKCCFSIAFPCSGKWNALYFADNDGSFSLFLRNGWEGGIFCKICTLSVGAYCLSACAIAAVL